MLHCLGELDDLPVRCAITQSLVRRLAVGLDLEVRDQPRGIAHKPWSELVVHVKVGCVQILRSRPQRATLLCSLLVGSVDAAGTRAGAKRCVEKYCVMLPILTHQLCQLFGGLLLIRQENDARPARAGPCLSDDSNRVFVLSLRDHCREHST